MKEFPKVSIIIATYNSASVLEKCLESVFAQTYQNKEVIIIDGGSKDGTLEIIKRYSDLIGFWKSEPDNGVYDAMNKGIDNSTGEYLYFLGSDDTFFDEKVLEKVFTDKKNIKYDIIYGNVLRVPSKIIYDNKFNLKKLKYSNICHQAIFTRRKVFDLLGKFNTDYKIYADWDFNIKWMMSNKIKKRFILLTISIFSDTGLCSREKDYVFLNKKDQIIEEYLTSFPIVILYRPYLIYRTIRNYLLKLK